MGETVCSFIHPTNQLMMFPLAHIDMIEQDTSTNPFTMVRKNGFHSGSILDISACFCRPIVATISIDRTIRLWNYTTWECEISFDCGQEEPLSVTLHPSGFHVLVGYKERVRIYNILKDTLKEHRSMPLKNCRNLKFSKGGHMFACAYGINLEIYDTYSFALLNTLSGHIRPIRNIEWAGQNNLYSVGMDGALIGWDANAGVRIDEKTMAPNMFNCLAIDRTNRPLIICSTTSGELFDVRRDHDLLQDTLKNGTIHDCTSCGSLPVVVRNKNQGNAVTITNMIISHGNNALICGTSSGAIRIYPWPIIPGRFAENDNSGTTKDRTERFTEIEIHESSITGLEISNDDTFLFTTSEDGCLFVHEMIQIVNGVEMKNGISSSDSIMVDTVNFNTDSILVSKEDIEEKMLRITTLSKEMNELKSDTEYTLHVKDAEWGDQLKAKAEEMDMALNAERERYESLQQRHEAFVREHMEELDKRDNDHIKATQRTENQYEHKLAIEITR